MNAGSTLSVSFNARRNSLNAVRLILAASVIVSHSWPIGGYGIDPGVAGLSVGSIAVAGFFGISGYLITMSRDRSRGLVDFLWRRVLRIYPGYVGVLVVTAFVFAPLAVVLFRNGDWSPVASAQYLLHNIALVVLQDDIPGTLHGVPEPGDWDGSLWTLTYEFLCYIFVGLGISAIPARRRTSACIVLLVILTMFMALVTFGHVHFSNTVAQLARLGAIFAAGAALPASRARTNDVVARGHLGRAHGGGPADRDLQCRRPVAVRVPHDLARVPPTAEPRRGAQ